MRQARRSPKINPTVSTPKTMAIAVIILARKESESYDVDDDDDGGRC